MARAIERDAAAQRALFAGDSDSARAAFTAAAELYRESWEAAPPGSYGRLLGMLKSAALGGTGSEFAEYADAVLADEDLSSQIGSYATALAALMLDDDSTARESASKMYGGSDALRRTADAIVALAERDSDGYARALKEIVLDFEQRRDHLTGVPIADTALMLEQFAESRGMGVEIESPVLPKSTA